MGAILFLAFLTLAVDAIASELVVITPFPREVFETYQRAFEAQHPGVKVIVKQKTPQAAIVHIREHQVKPDSDLFWADDVEAFNSLKQAGLLEKYVLPKTISLRISPRVGSVSIRDPDSYYFGFALSGYGLIWNPRYLEIHKLPLPKEWTDLTNPAYFGHLVMSAPSKSATTHRIVELILQAYGWEKGWGLLLTACGNLGTVTKRSVDVPEVIISGQYGIGVVADFFALSAIVLGHPVEFVYPSVTSIIPVSVAIIKDAPHPKNARAFIHFLLSEEGQRLLFSPKIGRLPVIPDLYAQAPKHFPNPFVTKLTGVNFNAKLSSGRRMTIEGLFDAGIAGWFHDCKEAWGAVYKGEEAIAKARTIGADTSKIEAAVAESRRLLTLTPISEKQASDQALVKHFKENPEARSKFVNTEWVDFYQGNRHRVMKNQLGALVYTTEKMLNENREKIPVAEISDIEEALREGKKVLQILHPEQIRHAIDRITKASHKMAEAVMLEDLGGGRK